MGMGAVEGGVSWIRLFVNMNAGQEDLRNCLAGAME